MSTWAPLESNPEVLTKFLHKLGVSANWALFDVMGLDDETLSWISQPVKALILVMPVTDAYEDHRKAEDERLKAEPEGFDSELFFMRQVTHNACGTVAIIHGIANNKGIPLADGVLKNFIANAKHLTPQERGEALEQDKEFCLNHQAVAQEGQTSADIDNILHHFVALIHFRGELYELDGRKSFPIKHGTTSDDDFLQDAADLCKQFMTLDPEDVRFTVLALSPTTDP